jgi:hypothetical protein
LIAINGDMKKPRTFSAETSPSCSHAFMCELAHRSSVHKGGKILFFKTTTSFTFIVKKTA